jgi:hypothetical protein
MLSTRAFLWASDALLGVVYSTRRQRGRRVNACWSSTLSTFPSPAIVGRIQNEPQPPSDKSVSRYASPLAFLKAIFDSHY